MNTFILKWNPGFLNYTLDHFEEDFWNEINFNSSTSIDWSVSDEKSIKNGDTFYIVKVGDGKDGIVMKGVFADKPRKSRDWTEGSRVVYFSDLSVDIAIHPDSEKILHLGDLQQYLPEIEWEQMASELKLTTDQAKKLDTLWEKHWNTIDRTPSKKMGQSEVEMATVLYHKALSQIKIYNFENAMAFFKTAYGILQDHKNVFFYPNLCIYIAGKEPNLRIRLSIYQDAWDCYHWQKEHGRLVSVKSIEYLHKQIDICKMRMKEGYSEETVTENARKYIIGLDKIEKMSGKNFSFHDALILSCQLVGEKFSLKMVLMDWQNWSGGIIENYVIKLKFNEVCDLKIDLELNEREYLSDGKIYEDKSWVVFETEGPYYKVSCKSIEVESIEEYKKILID